MVRGLGYSQGKTRDQEAMDIATGDWATMTSSQIERYMEYMFSREIEIMQKSAFDEYYLLSEFKRQTMAQLGNSEETWRKAVRHVMHIMHLCHEKLAM